MGATGFQLLCWFPSAYWGGFECASASVASLKLWRAKGKRASSSLQVSFSTSTSHTPGARWSYCVTWLDRKGFAILPEELEEVSGQREARGVPAQTAAP